MRGLKWLTAASVAGAMTASVLVSSPALASDQDVIESRLRELDAACRAAAATTIGPRAVGERLYKAWSFAPKIMRIGPSRTVQTVFQNGAVIKTETSGSDRVDVFEYDSYQTRRFLKGRGAGKYQIVLAYRDKTWLSGRIGNPKADESNPRLRWVYWPGEVFTAWNAVEGNFNKEEMEAFAVGLNGSPRVTVTRGDGTVTITQVQPKEFPPIVGPAPQFQTGAGRTSTWVLSDGCTKVTYEFEQDIDQLETATGNLRNSFNRIRYEWQVQPIERIARPKLGARNVKAFGGLDAISQWDISNRGWEKTPFAPW